MESYKISSLGKRIQSLRQSQNLTQEELAHKANIPYATLTKIESGVIKNPSAQAITKIAEALGVSLENILIVETFEGVNCIVNVLDDVYETLEETGGEVFISGIDERKFLEADREAITSHIKRLAECGVQERLLAREGDNFFFAGPQSIYRWVPENLFNPTPIYVYGDKIAMIVWGPPQQVIIIKNPALADAYRKQFLFIWEKAKIPPKKTGDINEQSELEQLLLKRMGGRISAITDSDRKLIKEIYAKETNETYGNSFYYLCQAVHGIGKTKLGLKYFDGEMLAGIGLFNRSSLGGGWHFHIVHPAGNVDSKKILSLAKIMHEISGNPVFVKKVTSEQKDGLLNAGFTSIEKYPWHAEALEEDDTFPEQIIDIAKTLERVEGPGKNDLKDKYQRFSSKFGKQTTFKKVAPHVSGDAQEIVKKFFDYLVMKNLHISEPSDYDSIIFHPPLGVSGKQYFSEIVYVKEKPAALYAIESISQNTAGLYANIALHEEYPYISEFLAVYCCKLLKAANFTYLNLGGSETSGLFQFKEKFSPVAYNKMHWVVYKYE